MNIYVEWKNICTSWTTLSAIWQPLRFQISRSSSATVKNKTKYIFLLQPRAPNISNLWKNVRYVHEQHFISESREKENLTHTQENRNYTPRVLFEGRSSRKLNCSTLCLLAVMSRYAAGKLGFLFILTLSSTDSLYSTWASGWNSRTERLQPWYNGKKETQIRLWQASILAQHRVERHIPIFPSLQYFKFCK